MPRNYNLSIEYDSSTGGSNSDFDKSRLLYKLSMSQNCVVGEKTERVRELIEELTEKQKVVLKLTELDGWS